MPASNTAFWSLADLDFGEAELETLRPVVLRLTRVADAIFPAGGTSDVVLFDEGAIWRAIDPSRKNRLSDPASEIVRDTGKLLWVEQLLDDQRFNTHFAVTGPFQLRTYIGAPIRLASGEVIGALCHCRPRQLDHDPRINARLQDLADVVGFECDRIREARRKEDLFEQLSRSEQRLKAAADAANLYIYEVDYEAEELFKIGKEDAFVSTPVTYRDCARDPLFAIRQEDRPAVEEAYQRHVATGAPNHSEWRVNRDDKLVWVKGSAEVFYNEAGAPTRMIGSMQDITPRKLVELEMAEARAAAEAANVAKSAFLATMSHEIRTPLNGVLGMAQAMAAHALDEAQQQRLQVIRKSGEGLLAILNDILDLSKIEAGKVELEEVEFDMAEIVRGVAATLSNIAEAKDLKFSLRMNGLDGIYRGDPTRIKQVLYNLISNAVKFTQVGEIQIIARHDGGKLLVSVQDTGIGMTPEAVDGLFQKFSQADISITRTHGGTGLGLAICRELIEIMNGEIRVKSLLGKGSLFSICIPLPRLRDAGGAEAAEPVAGLAAPADGAAALRVLAAEDNLVNQLVLRTLLQQVGVEPTLVDNGALAVDAWKSGDWDMVLMDVQMPVMDGMSATREIRALEAAGRRPRTPIIALTANAMRHQVDEYALCGMDGHVAKPIEAAKLFEAMEAALSAVPAQALVA